MQSNILARAGIVGLAVIAMACGDPTKPKPTYPNSSTSYILYTLTNSPASVPNALLFLGGATRATAAFAFDVAFDIDSLGRAQVFPVRSLASDLFGITLDAGAPKRVGLQQVTGSYSDVREVPSSGYDTVAVQTIAAGRVLAVELRDIRACFSSLYSQNLYAKLVVDSVDQANRRLFVRTVVDLTCGFRSVVPDSLPER